MIAADGAKKESAAPSMEAKATITISRPMLLLGLALFAALISYVIVHVGEMERFALLLTEAQPAWLFLAAGLQVGTYLCAGLVWRKLTREAECTLPLRVLARISIEQLSINQLLPTGGVSGNLLVIHALRRRGLPAAAAIEVLSVEILSGYIGYAILAFLSIVALWWLGDITRVLTYSLGSFALIVTIALTAFICLLQNRNRSLPRWLPRLRLVARVQDSLKQISARHILSSRLLAVASALNVAIFILDGGTLWALMQVAGVPIGLMQCFVTIVVAFISGAVSFLPGGLGSFEAGSLAMLTLFHVPLEAALAGTLLFRGVALWLPLLLGLLFARKDVSIRI